MHTVSQPQSVVDADHASLPLITAQNVDLTNCDREQIHIPGSIQPHGILLAVNEKDPTVLQVSSNVKSILGVEPAASDGQPLSVLMHPSSCRYWEQQVLFRTPGCKSALPGSDAAQEGAEREGLQ